MGLKILGKFLNKERDDLFNMTNDLCVRKHVEIDREYIVWLEEQIKATPKAPKNYVEAYHLDIIKELDSGRIISVPSMPHRNLHQMIWIEGHNVYDGFSDERKATLDFLFGADKTINQGDQRIRFDIWYARTYCLNAEKDDDWIKEIVSKADWEAVMFLGERLENVDIGLK